MASADLKPSDRINIITSINGIDFGEGGILTPATKETLGGVIVGDGLDVDEDGRISTTGGGGEPYKLPIASADTLGGVKVGTNLEITPEGVLNATAGGGDTYVLPVATATSLGGVKVGSGISVTEDGTISAESGEPYDLPIASADTLGGVKVGSGLSIDGAGILSAIGGAGGGGSDVKVKRVEIVLPAIDTPLATPGGSGSITFKNYKPLAVSYTSIYKEGEFEFIPSIFINYRNQEKIPNTWIYGTSSSVPLFNIDRGSNWKICALEPLQMQDSSFSLTKGNECFGLVIVDLTTTSGGFDYKVMFGSSSYSQTSGNSFYFNNLSNSEKLESITIKTANIAYVKS